MFTIGKNYNRQSDLHNVYGGRRRYGITTSAKFPIIFVFTSQTKEFYGYKDAWQSEDKDELTYTGEGNGKDMTMTGGNKAIRDHEMQGKSIHVFEKISSGIYTYKGEFRYINHSTELLGDANGKNREAFIFRLKKVEY